MHFRKYDDQNVTLGCLLSNSASGVAQGVFITRERNNETEILIRRPPDLIQTDSQKGSVGITHYCETKNLLEICNFNAFSSALLHGRVELECENVFSLPDTEGIVISGGIFTVANKKGTLTSCLEDPLRLNSCYSSMKPVLIF